MIPLSLRQFASAIGADQKWVLNTAARLGRPFEYTADDARWLRLARSLNRDLRIPLPMAAALAAQALKSEETRPDATQPDATALDATRRHGIRIGVLRAKLRRPVAERVVQPPAPTPDAPDIAGMLTCLEMHGVRAVITGAVAEAVWGGGPLAGPEPTPVREPLELCYEGTSANVERLAIALRHLAARPRVGGPMSATVTPGASTVDLIALRSTPALALATRCGALDLRRNLPGVGNFDEAFRSLAVVTVLGAAVLVLELPALRRVRCATGGRSDIERLLLLEAVLALPRLEARHREMALRRARWNAA